MSQSSKKRDDVLIPQELCVRMIIPRSFKEWDKLALDLLLGSQQLDISIQLFGILGNRTNRPTLSTRRLEREIGMLQDTTDLLQKRGLDAIRADARYSRSEGNHIVDANWGEVVLRDIDELRFLERLRLWVPSVLTFYDLAKDYVFCEDDGSVRADADSSHDPLVSQLKKEAETINRSNKLWVFGMVMQQIGPFKPILDAVSTDHQDFIT